MFARSSVLPQQLTEYTERAPQRQSKGKEHREACAIWSRFQQVSRVC